MAITVFEAQPVAPNVHRLERYDSKGFGRNVLVVALPAGGTLVYSPSWLDDQTLERVQKLGEPKVLCAPNTYHHLTLEKFRQRWPKALAVAPQGALSRLERQGHPGLKPLEAALPHLPPGARFIQTEHTKSHEAWLWLPRGDGGSLLVADAFFNFQRPVTGLLALILRALKVLPGLRVSTTYQYLAVSNVTGYREWSLRTIQELNPTEVVLAHGAALSGADCAAKLVEATTARWSN